MARSVLFCEHRDLSCCVRPGDLCSGASPGMPGWYFCGSQEPLISYFREITANLWEHVFFKYMFQTYKGPIQIDAPSKVIAMLQSMSSNGYQKRIIVTKKFFFPVDRPKLARRFFRLLFSRNLACFAKPPPLPPQRLGEPLARVLGEPSPVPGEPSRAAGSTLH